jgi:hypothetical protein
MLRERAAAAALFLSAITAFAPLFRLSGGSDAAAYDEARFF